VEVAVGVVGHAEKLLELNISVEFLKKLVIHSNSFVTKSVILNRIITMTYM